MNPQQVESLKRAAILLGAMLLPGIVAIYPQLLGDAPLDVHAMIRAFAAAVVGGVISRYGEGVYDGRRAAMGNVIAGDVTPPDAPAPAPAPTIFAPPITPDALHDILTMATMLGAWERPANPPPAAISHRVVAPTPITGTGANVTIGADAPVKRSHHAAKVPVVAPIDVTADS